MKYFMIAFQSLKKKKSDAVALFFLILFATVMMYVGISIFSNLGNVLDATNERNNGADVWLGSSCPEVERIEDTILNFEGVEALERGEVQYAASAKYWQEGDAKEDAEEMGFLMESLEEERTISVPEIVDRGVQKKENSVVLPYYMHVAMGYETGDSIYLEVGEQVYQCEVYGFIEDVLFATPTNISVYQVWLAEGVYERMQSASGNAALQYTIYKVQLADEYASDDIESELYTTIEKEVEGFAQYDNLTLNYDTMRSGDMITASILTAILIVFALVIVLVTIVIICFSIQNSLERNMTNTGILEASGYTAGQLIASTLIEMGSVTAFGIFVGLALSPVMADVIGMVVVSSIGVRWALGFDFASAGITIITILLFVLLASYIVARRFRKISILDALRGGVKTHNFRRNHIPLDTTFLPTHVALGVKGILNQKKKSIAVLVITIVLAFACNAGFFLYQNMVLSMDNLLMLVGIEQASAQASIPQEQDIYEVGTAVAALDGVTQVNYYATNTISIAYNGVSVNEQTDCWEDTERLVTNTLVEGRQARYDNEIVLSSPICESLGAEVGDTVTVTSNEQSGEYLIVGMTQHISYLGRKAVMTFEGIQRINQAVTPNILMVYKDEDVTFAELKRAFHDLYPDCEIVDAEKVINATCSSISVAMAALCVLFNVCTILVMISIMFLMIRMKLTQENVRMGVDKALGFTTIQLITRVVMNYLPVVFVGTILGGALSYVSFNSLVSLCLSFCGIKSCNMDKGMEYMVLTVIIINVTAFLASIITSARIRKIEPCRMIKE